MESSWIRESIGDNSLVPEMPADSYLVLDVVQAINCGAEAADLDKLEASLPLLCCGGGGGRDIVVVIIEFVAIDDESGEPDLPGAPDAPTGGGGGGGYDGGDPEGVLVRHTNSCDLREPHRIYLQTSVVREFPSYQRQADR
nr:hypothetical protein [Tanacetum cinerariifolium]